MDRRNALRIAVFGAAASALPAGAANAAFSKKPPPPSNRDILYRVWSSDAELATGTSAGVTIANSSLVIGSPVGQRVYADPFSGISDNYDYATWMSPMVTNGFAASEAVASWNADTPGAC